MDDLIEPPALDLPDLAAIEAAHARIAPHVHRTPILTSGYLDALSGASLVFKAETFQKTGAFKARGASNAVLSLDDAQAVAGVATHSSGNHAAGLAYAARVRGIPCHVVMPRTAPAPKKAAVRAYGAHVVECEPTMEAREAALAQIVAATGATFVPPFDDPRVIAGQGTCALELLQDAPDLDAIIAPIGGGGLVSGICIAAAGLAPATSVYAAEPEGADDALRSLRAGRRLKVDAPASIADGLLTPIGVRNWHIVSRHLRDVLPVTDAEIVDAMRLLWERLKIVVEPSGATGLAALLRHRDRFAGQRVGIVLTGGNVDLERLPFGTAA